MSVRTKIAGMFTKDWATIPALNEVHVIASQKEPAPFTTVTAILTIQSVDRLPQAPLSHRSVSLALEVVSPLGDIDAGVEELEPVVDDILDYLGPRFTHSAAQAFLYAPDRFAFRIPFTVIANKE